MSASATWVYAVTRGVDAAIIDGLDGVSGAPARAIAGGPLTAVASSVDAAAFSEEALQRRLTDPAALERIARAHHRVIAAVAAGGPLLPLRLASIYASDDRVREMLAQRQAEFTATLGWLTGRAEYGVKVWADQQGLAAAPPAAPSGGRPSGRGAGAAYLSRRRDELAARDAGRARAAEAAAGIHDLLAGQASAAQQHEPQEAGDGELMVLNGSYLVANADVQAFTAAAGAAADGLPGFRLAVTGPWPPYSFAAGPGDSGREDAGPGDAGQQDAGPGDAGREEPG